MQAQTARRLRGNRFSTLMFGGLAALGLILALAVGAPLLSGDDEAQVSSESVELTGSYSPVSEQIPQDPPLPARYSPVSEQIPQDPPLPARYSPVSEQTPQDPPLPARYSPVSEQTPQDPPLPAGWVDTYFELID